ncbi:GATA zinc finger domain-containing protein 14-like [Rhopalosiphum maidis]|uniref:GATA zinc finger domain-containing protein 14-like n=1 Tax=Rhopalosiphum maidis TaxID=43146 RepID=UPI000F0048F6|nr:GATA zinc finger domain-containing protein 14-like [Rhopalosiphum maidis]XP_026818373.1 GATA zinc finger domain-containing protein 14-like [Rhopalosiphum maidis]
MAPKSVSSQNQNKSKNNIFLKKLNHALVINNNLQKHVEELSEQNKELSTTRNNLSMEKLSLQNENNSIKNSNIQLTTMHNTMIKKLTALEQTIQSCIPALVTLSQCIPSMLETVHEMSKFEIKDFNKEKKEKQTKFVRPMINGMTIAQPAVSIRRFDMSPIVESPSTSTEQTPKRPRKLSYRSSPQCKLNMEPYVRLKDVAAMLKNSKAVPNEEGPQRRLNESLGEGPSWLHNPENQAQSSNNNTNAVQNVKNSPKPTTSNEVQADVTAIASTSSGNVDNTNGIEERPNESISSINSSMLRNVTCRKRTRRSSESSSASDIDDSTSSSRPSRSASKNINYKEKSIGGKLRR